MLLPDLFVKVNISALVANYHIIQKQTPKAKCAAVVKANAYGLGLQPVATALAEAGCEFFFVATLEEGIELRSILPNESIAWFHGCYDTEQAEIAKRYKLIPVVNTMESLDFVRDVPHILHIDTGMNRLGIPYQKIKDIKPSKKMLYLMTHPACADEQPHPLNTSQYNIFKECVAHFPQAKATYANSGAVFLSDKYHFDLVRPGAALYGINPTPNVLNPMRPVVTLQARILQIRHIDTLSTVGYGATHEIHAGSVLATVACGYADGYLRTAGGKGYAIVENEHCAIVGRISMDLMVVDITLVHQKVAVGDYVELIGSTRMIDEVALNAGTIGYEILTRLGQRCYRVYE